MTVGSGVLESMNSASVNLIADAGSMRRVNFAGVISTAGAGSGSSTIMVATRAGIAAAGMSAAKLVDGDKNQVG
jgi:hypothetical protein